jgi:hypothetical protein
MQEKRGYNKEVHDLVGFSFFFFFFFGAKHLFL